MLSNTINVKCDPKTKERLEQLAEEEGRTLSDLCRHLLSKYALINNPTRIAVQQLLKDDGTLGQRFITEFIIEEEITEIDRILARKVRKMLGRDHDDGKDL